MPPLAVLGSLARDRIDGERRVGGGAYHAARGLRLLPGAEAVVVTKASDPELARPLSAFGFPVEFRQAASTPTFALHYEGDEREMHVAELGEPWSPEDAGGWVGAAIGDARWVQVAPLLRSDFPAETLAVLARGRRLLLDGQGLVRVPQTGPLRLDDAYDREVLRHLTVLKLAEEEARAILPDFGAASLAALGVPEVLLTFGSRGSQVFADGRLEDVPARPVEADATGAGDAFLAAYGAGRAAGLEPVPSARRAASLVETMLAQR